MCACARGARACARGARARGARARARARVCCAYLLVHVLSQSTGGRRGKVIHFYVGVERVEVLTKLDERGVGVGRDVAEHGEHLGP